MDQVNSAISSNLAIIAGGLVFVCLLVLVLAVEVLIQTRRLARLRERLDGLTRGVDGRSLESVIDAHLETVFRVARDLDALSARATALETAARQHFDRVGLIRFNPFEDTGGNQSFALALLDDDLDGFIVSSLHSRTGTRIYAKSITGGTAEATLSAEEAQALDLARAHPAPRPAPPSSRAAGGRSGGSAPRVDPPSVRSPLPRGGAAASQVPSTGLFESIDPADVPLEADFLDRRLSGQDGGSPTRPSGKDTPGS